jgi:molecular chaperone DnaK
MGRRKPMSRAIGIDLGTTNSCAAIMEGGRPRIITDIGQGPSIPSVFTVDTEGEEVVGQLALDQAVDRPTETIMASKRLIGRNFHSKTIDRVRQVFTYELVEGDENEVLIKVQNKVFTLEEISGAILRKIKDVSESALEDPVSRAVITVPAYFNERQRQAVRNAGDISGLEVLRILNEPTAAALSYGLGRDLSQRIAVYDLGGGTFDISIIDIKGRVFEVIATGGDTFLGGVDFDDRLMQYILEDFLHKHDLDLAWDRSAVQRIRAAAETAKINLSQHKTVRIHITDIAVEEGKSLDIDMVVPRAVLERLTDDLVDRTVGTVERIFEQSGLRTNQIDQLLMVGGQSRMPLVRRKIESFLGLVPSHAVHPELAVGIGAAIMAHSLDRAGKGTVELLDVLPMSIGLSRADGTMEPLFSRYQRLPSQCTRVLTTFRDDQETLLLRVYQGDAEAVLDNSLLGTFLFSGLRPGPAGSIEIEVQFKVDGEGVLRIEARDLSTNQHVDARLKMGESRPRRIPRPKTEKPSQAPPPIQAPLSMGGSSLAKSIEGATTTPLPHPSHSTSGMEAAWQRLVQWIRRHF